MPNGQPPIKIFLEKHSSQSVDMLAKTHPYNPLWAQLGETRKLAYAETNHAFEFWSRSLLNQSSNNKRDRRQMEAMDKPFFFQSYVQMFSAYFI